MPPEALDFTRRAELSDFPELMDEPCSREVLRHCLRDLARVNRWFLAYRPTLRWLSSLSLETIGRPVRILDAGCGYGDSLRRIERWANERNIPVELTGCDLNSDSIAIAREASPARSRIRWIATDIFAFGSNKPIDIIVSSLFTHHLTEPDIVRFVSWMETAARIGWFINDLRRSAKAYYSFKVLAWALRWHRFVRHDGPVSVRRAFLAEDWQRMCRAAGLPMSEIRIEEKPFARLCVSRRKP